MKKLLSYLLLAQLSLFTGLTAIASPTPASALHPSAERFEFKINQAIDFKELINVGDLHVDRAAFIDTKPQSSYL